MAVAKWMQLGALLLVVIVDLIDSLAIISLVQTRYIVYEGQQFSVEISKTGSAASTVNVVLELINRTSTSTQDLSSGNHDFIGTSRSTVFPAGTNDVTKSLVFTVSEDLDPEPDETFTLILKVTNGDGGTGNPSVALVTIVASDEPFGIFSFDMGISSVYEEEESKILSLRIMRSRGRAGTVALTFVVEGSGNAQPGIDISPAAGSIIFLDGEAMKNLELVILPDEVAENDEYFTVRLTGASGGQSVDASIPGPSIQIAEAQVVIRQNDAPIHFALDEYRVDEADFMTAMQVLVYRGQETDGTYVGPIGGTASVQYLIEPVNAEPGYDFLGSSGVLSFNSGQTQERINLQILSDNIPEVAESIKITLVNATGEVTIADPSVTYVIINANDEPNGVLSIHSPDGNTRPQFTVNEDIELTFLGFNLTRNGGSFGTVTIDWKLVYNGTASNDAGSDILPMEGTATLNEGETWKVVPLNIIQDSTAEPSERFTFHLLPGTVTGGARAEGILSASLIIEDSDSAHGIVVFALQSSQSLEMTETGRNLVLSVLRQGGTVGNLTLQYTVAYKPDGNTDIFQVVMPSSVTMPAEQRGFTFRIPIKDSAFLSVGSVFEATLLGVQLAENDVPTYNSPRLGGTTIIVVPVNSESANGEVGFSSTATIRVQEPLFGIPFTEVMIPITRVGTSGNVSLNWTMAASGLYAAEVTEADVTPWFGTITMMPGESAKNLRLEILPDDIAETDEELTITLSSIEPANTQRFRPGADVASVVIEENDAPGGTFEFGTDVQPSYTVMEEGEAIKITIVRTGSALVRRCVEYVIEPNGDVEFYGGTNVLCFDPGLMMQEATIIARGDGMPELTEVFMAKLMSFGDSTAHLGTHLTFNITVLSNDNPYGVFHFSSTTPEITVAETSESSGNLVSIPVLRGSGRHGTASVSWHVADQETNMDLEPLSGTLVFGNAVGELMIEMIALADEIPEEDEQFTVVLSDPTDGAILGTPLSTTFTVLKNEDAIYFKEPSIVYLDEPGVATLTIVRDGPLDVVVTVNYMTRDGGATATSQDYVPIAPTLLTFDVGEKEKQITVTVLADDEPEPNEEIFVDLFDPTGDVAVYYTPVGTVIINANDDANGYFSFIPPAQKVGQEGALVTFGIIRAGGHYGECYVHWEILDRSGNQRVPNGTDFASNVGFVTFEDGVTANVLELTPLADGEPEYLEGFVIRLYAVTGGGPNDQVGHLELTDLTRILEIAENDDPSGVFTFDENFDEFSVAEDFDAGQDATAMANIAVVRNQGQVGTVELVWAVFSYQIAGANDLPDMRDLLFLGEIPSVFDTAASQTAGRPRTGTIALKFDGCNECHVTVAPEHQMPAADISDGFSMSAWMKTTSEMSGFILAKTSEDGATFYYSLRVSTSSFTTQFEFRYSTVGNTNFFIVENEVGRAITDEDWHLVLVTISDGVYEIFLDGVSIGLSQLQAVRTQDAPGLLYVGAAPPGSDHFIGVLQDVRVYSRKLDQGEISSLYEMPTAEDLDPVSGYLTVGDGVSFAMITIQVTNDNEEESNEVFAVKLISAKGGARIIDGGATAIMTVLKSDNANGLFGFSGACSPLSAPEGTSFNCPVARQRGDADIVHVSWEVRERVGAQQVAIADFVESSGEIVFIPGQRQAILELVGLQDGIPELTELFDVKLTGALSEDGIIGTTLTSGASINPALSTTNVTIANSDYPFGLLQFSTGTPPSSTDPPVAAATEPPTITVPEEAGVIRLLVVRAQGLTGSVSVEWRTQDGTAVSAGKNPPDFLAGVNRLVFAPGQRYGYIPISIIDNAFPEPDKTFTVELVNPTGGADVGIGSVLTVVIEHSDQAHGVFRFASESLDVDAIEASNAGVDIFNLKVNREGGAIAEVNLTWSLMSDATDDFVEDFGYVTFADGQRSADIPLQIRGDNIPELDETVLVQLIDVTLGSIDIARRIATVNIPANDDPYGAFAFSIANRPIYVQEGANNVTLTVERVASSGTNGTVRVNYRTLADYENFPYLPGTPSRANQSDFVPASGTLIFTPGVRTMTISVSIREDSDPEVDESVYLILDEPILVEGAQEAPVLNSPTLVTYAQMYGQIIIRGNDYTNGILQLSASAVKFEEDHTDPLVYVERTAGLYGQVTVKFHVIQGTALDGFDYSYSTTEVILGNGVSRKAIPVELLDDIAPELEETFTIQLLDEITGGASLGTNTDCVVTIAKSDDPHGSFGFELTGEVIEEPPYSQLVQVAIVRAAGASGVVTVQWQATLNGEILTTDITPTLGSVNFVSNEQRQIISIGIVADEVPEGMEDIILTLTGASNGGVINPDQANYTISILPNDGPHGTIQFAEEDNILIEPEVEETQYVKVARIGGTYGQIQVYYQTRDIDLLTEIERSGSEIFEYFFDPIPGKLNTPISGTQWSVKDQPDPLVACATFCLLTQACLSFDFNSSTPECHWFTVGDTSALEERLDYVYYLKDNQAATELYSQVATSSADYSPVSSQSSIIIPDGASEGSIPINIRTDDIPELNERFLVELTSVQLINLTPLNPSNEPELGQLREAYVTIAANDNANGVFSILSRDPRSTDGHLTEVMELEQYSVELVVERQGGTIGQVSVRWGVNVLLSTASQNLDYIADGAILTFLPGVTQRTFTIGIEDDAIPENDETIVIELSDPQGGAIISDASPSVTVAILANDYVAGQLGFSQTAYLVQEGTYMTLTVTRSAPALGTVTADWMISTTNSAPPDEKFAVHNGTLKFAEGEQEKQIQLEVLISNAPMINQEYTIGLDNIETQGIPVTGSAGVDPQTAISVITIEGGNDPHGVFSFAPSSVIRHVTEANVALQMYVDRKFGAIGDVRVYYDAHVGAIQERSDTFQYAMSGADFLRVDQAFITIHDGENVGLLIVQIYDDTIPEVDEAFLVNLTRVELVGAINTTFQPKLASAGTVAQVVIDANDGTRGQVQFPPASARVYVEEGNKNVTLTIRRILGTFGSVSVFCFAQTPAEGARRGVDFDFDPQEVYFMPGESEKQITIFIYDDEIPEPNEDLEIILASPKDGLELGNPYKATVTITSSDEAGGFVSFETSEDVVIIEPNIVGSVLSTAELRVIRAPGVFGTVNVPFEITTEAVTNADGEIEEVVDLVPVEGILTFADREGLAVLTVEAVADNEPEEREAFYVVLLPPDNGATLGAVTRKKVIIERNDAPYGLVEIYPQENSENSTIMVEEYAGTIFFDVLRTQGSMDSIQVDVVTRGVSAHAQQGQTLYLSVTQELHTLGAHSWYSYEWGGDHYLLLLSSHRTGELTTFFNSNGSVSDYDPDRVTQTVLYRWQGALVPIQTIETDGATDAEMFTIDGVSYLFIANFGSSGRFETSSRLYAISDGMLTVVQDLTTKGAKSASYLYSNGKHFLFVANYKDNSGTVNVNSDLYQWDAGSSSFSNVPVQYLATRGAVATETMQVEEHLLLAVANHYDLSTETYEVSSVIYELDNRNRFTILQQIPTKGAIDLKYFTIGTDHYLVVANERDDVGVFGQNVVIHLWDIQTTLFSPIQEIGVHDVQTVNVYKIGDKVNLIIANRGGNSIIYTWSSITGQFSEVWEGIPALDLHPIVVDQEQGPMTVIMQALPIDGAGIQSNAIYLASHIDFGESDYVFSSMTLNFEEGQTYLSASVCILEDDLPEDTETLVVELTNPLNGAEIGLRNEVIIDILSNDNAHGIIQFAEDSILKREEELVNDDNTVIFNLERNEGTYGRVVIKWRATGENNGIYDIAPVEGAVEFADGQSVATITIVIKDDRIPELDELTLITLTEVLESGSRDPMKGAQIGVYKQSRMVVMANDSPHGVVAWERPNYLTTEPEGTDTSTMVHIIREQGTLGHLRIYYITGRAGTLPVEQQALSGEDYVATQSSVDMLTDVTRAAVEIPILADIKPEVEESFLISITGVQLVGNIPTEGTAPSVKATANVTTVSIAENDNARGIVQFDVDRNVENRVDTFEGAGILQLRVVRTVGSFGSVEVFWQASPREATTDDFSPSSGTVKFEEGETHAFIDINIIDDILPEDLQTFDVQLIRVTSGGATVGSDNAVLVGILRNDSPTGIFSFVSLQKSVREARSINDPDGVVSFDIYREGTEGLVNVIWRLSSDAVDDFQVPLTGSVSFGPGETYKSITVRTKPDNILEGEERFTLSLVSADNNADISPTQSDATIIILPDAGASGVISILPNSRSYLMAEPSATYDGHAEVHLSRGPGIYGVIKVTWRIVPQSIDAFMQNQGELTFYDEQTEAVISIQTKDDNAPELRQTFTLQLTSATGGATIDASSSSAQIIVVASDYPHGLFQFPHPPDVTVSEESGEVQVTVERDFGSVGDVRVFYTTVPDTATSFIDLDQDFYAATGSLVFNNNQRQKSISVDIVNDFLAEGPEVFFINLTRVELLQPLTNNYTAVNGLELDMAPALGPLQVKRVIIDKSDNAEGIVQFPEEAQQFTGYEVDGVCRIPVERGPGSYGTVSVSYAAVNGTATSPVDFVLPSDVLVLHDGMSSSTINVTLVNDDLEEFAEQFEVKLLSVQGGALLGGRTTSLVTISKSDYPNGAFGFKGQTLVTIPNPDTTRTLVLTIERTGGVLGKQIVRWRILGPNSAQPLEETNDISYYTPEGFEATNGFLEWENGQAGEKSITIIVKPHSGWEIQKEFLISIYDITGFPISDGNGQVNPDTGEMTITIQKYGHPNGIVRFDGDAQQTRTFEEPATGRRILRFSLYRREGTYGQLEVTWNVVGPVGESLDIDPQNGTAIIEADKRDGEVTFELLADDEAELDERFTVFLTKVVGGGEIDTSFNTSSFIVRYNDYPHGRFAIYDEDQTVVVTSVSDLQRQVRINVTRHEGVVGKVTISYTIVYDQEEIFVHPGENDPSINKVPHVYFNKAQSGVSYLPSSGTIAFEDGQRYGILYVPVENSAYLALGSTFTLTLTSVQFIGVGVTMPPELLAGATLAKVNVPASAANSEVGFEATTVAVDEETNQAVVNVLRRGSYGALQVDWQSGYPRIEEPLGFSMGAVTPDAGTVSMPNSINSSTVRVQVTPNSQLQSELFALNMPNTPLAIGVPGGARLRSAFTLVKFDPYGVARFASDSRLYDVTEPEDRPLEITLQVERLYGSLDNIQIRYRTFSATAVGDVDFVNIENGAIHMDEGETSANIYIEILPDTVPEEDEYFFVNLTSIIRLPTDSSQNISPRISDLHSSCQVNIRRNNDPYGVLSIIAAVQEPDYKASEPSTVQLIIKRTGGSFGMVSVLVRTIGGQEPWDYDVAIMQSDYAETIGQALANRDLNMKAIEGQDYERLDVLVTFQEGENEKTVTLTILDDSLPEDDEQLFVYLVPRTDGVRVAQPTLDNGKKGFASVVIRKNDFWNGLVGFYAANSSVVSADEDSQTPVLLTIERQNANFGNLTVYWNARINQFENLVKSDSLDLTAKLATVTDDVICVAGQRFCVFQLPLMDDQIPENETSFIVELSDISSGAQIDPARKYALVSLMASDYPNGMVQFSPRSQLVYVDKQTNTVRLEVERIGYVNKRVMVHFSTMDINTPGIQVIAGVRVYPALVGADYEVSTGSLIFQPGERTKIFDIDMNALTASDNPYPKMFQVALSDVTNGAELGEHRANVTIVDRVDIQAWETWAAVQGDMTNATIDSLMGNLLNTVQQPLTPNQASIVLSVLESAISVAEKKPLLQGTRAAVMSVFCKLLDPTRGDATHDNPTFGDYLLRFAYSYLVAHSCNTCCTTSQLIHSPDCSHVRFAVAKWYPEDINGYRYEALNDDYFKVPSNLLRVQDHGRSSPNPKCEVIAFIEYWSSQWFVDDDTQLLNDKVITVGIKDSVARILSDPVEYKVHTPNQHLLAQRAECVYYDEDDHEWTTGEDICWVQNDLGLAIHDYVLCRCRHMSRYAVISHVKNPNLIGYPVWFYISCFICMVGLAFAIICHHTCIIQSMFAANLLMHMCFAVFATELCYLIDAYLSPGHLLEIMGNDGNYRCIVMALFVHYFFLTQFTWMMTQAVNFWKVLVLNDEHTERKYVFYFLLGWGLPMVLVAVFYVITYCIYHYTSDLPSSSIYGDINLNKDICFVMNPYAALAGVISPAIICLMVVGVVFIQAFQVTPQWQAYDDMYRGRYNIHEMRTLLLFWALIVVTWLWGGLHMAYGQLWMLVLFCIFNITVGIYAFVVYAALRNPCLPCFRPQKQTYAINFAPSEMADPGYGPMVAPPSVIGSMKGSKLSLMHDVAWDKDSISHGSNLRVKRTAPQNPSVYVMPPPPPVIDKAAPHHHHHHHAAPNHRRDSQDFDELIHALKSGHHGGGGGYSPSDASQTIHHDLDGGDSSSQYETGRRINIADTHL